jgi:DNA-directed RNA polymerase omega subunit
MEECMKREEDSLMTPALEDLQARIPQKYELVLVATRRAKQLIRQQRMAGLGVPMESGGMKPLSVALRDIAEGRISVDDILAPEFDVDEYHDETTTIYADLPEMSDDFSQAFDAYESNNDEVDDTEELDDVETTEPDDPQFNWSGD